MEETNKETICQCLRCGHVFPLSQKQCSKIYPFGACPICGGGYTTLYSANHADGYYLNCLANKFSR